MFHLKSGEPHELLLVRSAVKKKLLSKASKRPGRSVFAFFFLQRTNFWKVAAPEAQFCHNRPSERKNLHQERHHRRPLCLVDKSWVKKTRNRHEVEKEKNLRNLRHLQYARQGAAQGLTHPQERKIAPTKKDWESSRYAEVTFAKF